MDTRPGHAAQLLVYESFGCPRMDMNFKKFQEHIQICFFMLMCGDARVLENRNAQDITMTQINGNQWTFSDFSQKSIQFTRQSSWDMTRVPLALTVMPETWGRHVGT